MSNAVKLFEIRQRSNSNFVTSLEESCSRQCSESIHWS